ncbi:MAG: hypothetical protein C5B47_05135 [Verrucomicrobia bacterium]|nr:MAG: hypothetical protein C5B47_05135 [Verrucomicrobiota bacterium]
MRISLITPTFNQAEFIEETIQSVLDQKYPDLEWIVIDALSTDSTPQILARYAHLPWLKIIREADEGQSDAINKGMRLATGTIASWLNSDDLLVRGALHHIAQAFLDHPAATVIYGRGAKINRSSELLRVVPYRPFDRKRLATALEAVQPAIYFRRDVFWEAGGLRKDLAYAMDWDLLIRLAQRGEVIALDTLIAKIRYYENTKTATGGWKRMREIAQIGKHHNGFLDWNHLSFKIRQLTPRLPLARKIVDEFFWRMARTRPIMVLSWPDIKQR